MSSIRAVRIQFDPSTISPNLAISTFDPLDLSAPEMQKKFFRVEVECDKENKRWWPKHEGQRGVVKFFGEISISLSRPFNGVVGMFDLDDNQARDKMRVDLAEIAKHLLDEWLDTQHIYARKPL